MSWLDRFANVVRGRNLNPEIDEELRFHIDSAIDDNVAAGMTEAEARRDALRRFGSRAGLLERTRDANVLVGLERVWHDTLPRHHWPGGDPLGKRLQLIEPHGRTVEI